MLRIARQWNLFELILAWLWVMSFGVECNSAMLLQLLWSDRNQCSSTLNATVYYFNGLEQPLVC